MPNVLEALGIPDILTPLTDVSEAAAGFEQTEQLQVAAANLSLLVESLAQVELALEDRGWRILTLQTDQQMTRDGLRRAAELCRVMAVVNPLIRRAISLRTAYVWGGGVQISARANGQSEDNDAEQDVNTVVQAWLEDKATRKVLTSAAARETNERTLGTDGVFALALFTKPMTGAVQPRRVPASELVERITNPQDADETWYWKRVWVEMAIGPDGARSSESRTTYYPDIDYRPSGVRLQTIGGAPVMWDAPVAVLNVNALPEADFGIGDAFAAIPWARGYKEYLEDWARVMKSLSRFTWRQSAGKQSAARKAADTIRAATQGAATYDDPSGSPTGAAVVGSSNMGTLEAIPKSGAVIDAESGKPLAGMVASAMDVPLTMLLSDPGSTGARAVAETLDQPTELMAGQRRDVWADYHRQILDYLIDAAVKAPRGPLTGTVTRDDWGREVIELDGDTERTIEFVWPDLDSVDVPALITAIAAADATEKLPPVITLKLLLSALGVRDADEIVEKYTDENGDWVDPYATAGDQAARDHEQGTQPPIPPAPDA